ncbi:MAG TPA: tRNA pseudouridine(55) synthase TruB [Flavobacteriales bacterium]|nr:tRNA pseudouridine(55) synthase TruB [Flavobacteriales bacterium]
MINPESGYLLVDKPLRWTSFQAVNKVKYLLKHHLGTKLKIGHAGTLDPLAEGLLIMCYGKMTKRIHQFQDMEKEYSGIFKLGATTPSFDLETTIDQHFPTDHITPELVKKAAANMIGIQMQLPPLYSAKKIEGSRAYEYARKGIQKELKENRIEISKFDAILEPDNEVKFLIRCSKGTYIRSLANDFGKALKSGAYLKSLRRTAIGQYRVDDAHTIEDLEKILQSSE